MVGSGLLGLLARFYGFFLFYVRNVQAKIKSVFPGRCDDNAGEGDTPEHRQGYIQAISADDCKKALRTYLVCTDARREGNLLF